MLLAHVFGDLGRFLGSTSHILFSEFAWFRISWNLSKFEFIKATFITSRKKSQKSAKTRELFSGFFQMVPLLNDENKSCLNELKFWEGSQNPKWIKFWKCWLSIICGSQKSAKIHKTVGKVILSFYPMDFLSSFLYFLKTTHNKPKRVFCL